MATIEEERQQSLQAANDLATPPPRSTEEYIQMQRDAMRKAAHEKSLSRTEASIPIIKRENGKTVYGNACLYTATDNYGKAYKQADNNVFASDPGKYGFRVIKVNELQPGDIVQRGAYDDLTGKFKYGHAMIFDGYDENGRPLFNYSAGTDNPEMPNDLRKHNKYLSEELDDYFYRGYRFVGTPEDETRWSQEYRNTHPVNSIPSSPLERPGHGHYRIEKH